SCEARIKTLEAESRLIGERFIQKELENAELKKSFRLIETELAIYREIDSITLEAVDIKAMLDRIMDMVIKTIDADAGTLYRLDDNGELVFEVVKGPVADRLRGEKMNVCDGIAGWIARTGMPYVANEVVNDPIWNKEFGSKTKYVPQDMLGVPLKAKKGIIGVIEVLNKKEGQPFEKRDLAILSALALRIATILEKTRLFLELERSVKQFTTLAEVGTLLNSTLDQKVIRKRAMEAITFLMNAEVGSLLLVDDENRELYFEVALGDKGDKVKEIRLKIGEGIAGWVAEHGEPLLIKDVSKDPRFYKSADQKTEFITRDMVCVPVKVKDKVIGVLQAINRLEGIFADDDIKLFQLFSNQVAIALDNARLYEEIRETFFAVAEALAEAIEKRDPYTGGHTKRVVHYSLAAAKYLNLTPKELEFLKLSAILHDIGKIGVDDSVLRKPGKLDDNEAELMKMHPMMGADIMRHVKQLNDLIPGMKYHHERPDGKGYPDGLKDGEIPVIARIISVADTYDAMTSTRPYRKGLPHQTAIDEIKKYAGTQFDRDVALAFVKAFEQGEIGGGL
ncbi:MAG: GAF domain-containing protein, partial [Deltaproteobacteria bacterium]|nr:GAF domain-containing protein [Deltaproteobacteria bacterium]